MLSEKERIDRYDDDVLAPSTISVGWWDLTQHRKRSVLGSRPTRG